MQILTQNAYDKDIGLVKSYYKGNGKNLNEDIYLKSLIPTNFNEFKVIDLGCGNGWFCRGVIEMGASKVIGIDLSSNMIDQAKSLENEKSKIEYQVQDLQQLQINELDIGTIDFAFSSFTTHYLTDLESFFKNVYLLLKPDATFLFSTEHPIKSSSKTLENDFTDHTFSGEETSRKVWPLSNYSDEGIRYTNWLGFKGIVKYHYTISTYINTLIKVGFKIQHIGEPLISKIQLDRFSKSGDISIESNRPDTLYIKVSK